MEHYTRLTGRQADVLRSLSDFWERNSFGPTLAQIGTQLGITPPTVLAHLRHLEKAGKVERLEQEGEPSRNWAPVQRKGAK